METWRSHSPVFYDTRKSLGYGLSVPSGRNDSRRAGSQFPYTDPDPYEEDDFIEGEGIMDDIITKTHAGYVPLDTMAASKTDPFYFVAGNLKINELAVANDSISPLPGLYKKRGVATGGFSTVPAFDERPAMKTGTFHGYSSSPPEPSVPLPVEIGAYTLADLLDDDELAVAKVHATQNYIDSLSHGLDDEASFG